jgi:sensor histidine kinase YesM
MLLTWSGEGLLLALTVGLFERWAAPRPLEAGQLALAVLAGSVVGVLVWQLFMQAVMRDRMGILLLRDYVNQPVEFFPIALYNVWMMLFCGGLAAALHLSRQRHARTVAILRAAELAREASQRKLAQEQLAAVRASVDPDFLFQKLASLEQLYESDSAGADRVLEELIVFLRGAVADVRAASVPVAQKEGSR